MYLDLKRANMGCKTCLYTKKVAVGSFDPGLMHPLSNHPLWDHKYLPGLVRLIRVLKYIRAVKLGFSRVWGNHAEQSFNESMYSIIASAAGPC